MTTYERVIAEKSVSRSSDYPEWPDFLTKVSQGIGGYGGDMSLLYLDSDVWVPIATKEDTEVVLDKVRQGEVQIRICRPYATADCDRLDTDLIAWGENSLFVSATEIAGEDNNLFIPENNDANGNEDITVPTEEILTMVEKKMEKEKEAETMEDTPSIIDIISHQIIPGVFTLCRMADMAHDSEPEEVPDQMDEDNFCIVNSDQCYSEMSDSDKDEEKPSPPPSKENLKEGESMPREELHTFASKVQAWLLQTIQELRHKNKQIEELQLTIDRNKHIPTGTRLEVDKTYPLNLYKEIPLETYKVIQSTYAGMVSVIEELQRQLTMWETKQMNAATNTEKLVAISEKAQEDIDIDLLRTTVAAMQDDLRISIPPDQMSEPEQCLFELLCAAGNFADILELTCPERYREGLILAERDHKKKVGNIQEEGVSNATLSTEAQGNLSNELILVRESELLSEGSRVEGTQTGNDEHGTGSQTVNNNDPLEVEVEVKADTEVKAEPEPEPEPEVEADEKENEKAIVAEMSVIIEECEKQIAKLSLSLLDTNRVKEEMVARTKYLETRINEENRRGNEYLSSLTRGIAKEEETNKELKEMQKLVGDLQFQLEVSHNRNLDLEMQLSKAQEEVRASIEDKEKVEGKTNKLVEKMAIMVKKVSDRDNIQKELERNWLEELMALKDDLKKERNCTSALERRLDLLMTNKDANMMFDHAMSTNNRISLDTISTSNKVVVDEGDTGDGVGVLREEGQVETEGKGTAEQDMEGWLDDIIGLQEQATNLQSQLSQAIDKLCNTDIPYNQASRLPLAYMEGALLVEWRELAHVLKGNIDTVCTQLQQLLMAPRLIPVDGLTDDVSSYFNMLPMDIGRAEMIIVEIEEEARNKIDMYLQEQASKFEEHTNNIM
eukprot:Ihof_evm1s406 gene=Ihof_evmTU1s406